MVLNGDGRELLYPSLATMGGEMLVELSIPYAMLITLVATALHVVRVGLLDRLRC